MNQNSPLKEAEEKLRESKDLLQSVFDTSSNIISVLKSVRNAQDDIVDFEYILTNASSQAFFGQDLVGQSLLQVFPHLLENGVFESLKKVAHTGVALDTELVYDQEARNSWFRVAATRLQDGIMLSQRDITAHKLAELEVQRQTNLLKTIVDTAFGGMALLKAVRNAQGYIVDFRYEFANPVKAARLGLPLPELIGSSLVALFPAVKESGMWERLLQVVETGQTLRNLEEWHRGGKTIFIDQQYVKVEDGVLAWDKDITRVKKAEQAAREKTEQFRSLVENTPDAITRWDQWLTLTYANPVFTARTGRSLKWLQGKTALEVGLPAEIARPWMDKILRVFETGEAQDHYNQHGSPDGGAAYYFSRLVPEFAPDGTVQSVLAIARDITEVKILEEESLQLKLNQQKELLLAILEAQENERRRIAEGLHNGIGQLLYAVKLNLDQLRTLDPIFTPQQQEARKKADQLLVEAIDQTRRISHELMPITLEDLGLEAAIRDICGKLNHPGLHFQCWAFNLNQPLDKSLQLAIYRIAQELGNNIVKHARASQASLILRQEAEQISIQAEDNGHGFTPGQVQSNGLGLKSIQDRVKLLNGHMEIDSGPGRGTLISIYLPLAAANL